MNKLLMMTMQLPGIGRGVSAVQAAPTGPTWIDDKQATQRHAQIFLEHTVLCRNFLQGSSISVCWLQEVKESKKST